MSARATLRSMRRTPRLWIWGAVLVVHGLVVGTVPLFGVLGFELALATSVVAAILGLDVGAAFARARARQRATGASVLDRAAFAGRAVAHSTATAALLAVTLISIPAVICAVRGLWVRTCDWSFGLHAYLALPVATAALAGALGHLLGLVVGPRRFAGAIVAQLPLLLLAGYGLYRFHAAPPVFTYNPIVGYFPGNLYDENVQLGSPLAWARVEQLAWVIALGALVAMRFDVPSFRVRWRVPRPAGRRLGVLALALGAAGGATLLHVNGGALGFKIDAEDIQAELGGRLETAHFVIHYATTKAIEDDLALIAADHEFRYAQVVAQLGVEPPEKIHSYYFATTAQKARWIGARDVEMAKPWRREIYLDHRAFPHPSLRHEIAHAVASVFGDEIFGVAMQKILGLPILVNPGLVEGLAVAVDWPGGYDHPTPHEAVRAMTAMGMTPTIAELLSLRFLSVSSARGYTTAGSFLRFLLDRYGAPPLRALYHSGGDFDAAYGRPRAALEGEWRAMIDTIRVPPEAVEASRERFRRGGMFSRPCPHAIAARHERAGELLGEGDRKGAIAELRDVCADAPAEPRYRMELGDYLIGGAPADQAEAEAIWTALAAGGDDDATGPGAPDVTPTVRAEAYERLARVATGRGDRARVRALIAHARELPVESGARRQLDAEAFALDHAGPAGDALRGYFFGTPATPATPATSHDGMTPAAWALTATVAEPTLGFAHYLAGLQAMNTGDWARSASELDRALDLGLPGLAFVKNAARKLIIAAYRAGDRVRAGKAIAWLASGQMTAADRLLADDWQARLLFDLHP